MDEGSEEIFYRRVNLLGQRTKGLVRKIIFKVIRHYVTLIRLAKILKGRNISCWRGCRKKSIFKFAGRNVNYDISFGK